MVVKMPPPPTRSNSEARANAFIRTHPITGSPVFDDFEAVVEKHGIFHAERLENVFLGKCPQRFPAHPRDNDSQQMIIGITILVFCSGRETELLLTRQHIKYGFVIKGVVG